MKTPRRSFILLIFILLASTAKPQSITRSVVANLGHFFSNGSGSLSATLGEPMTETFSSSENHLTQGFQQSSFQFTSIEREDEEEKQLWLFPNPVKEERVRIRTQNGFPENSTLRVRDLQGKLIYSSELKGREEMVDLTGLPSGTYIFRVIAPEKILGTYRVEKLR